MNPDRRGFGNLGGPGSGILIRIEVKPEPPDLACLFYGIGYKFG